MILTLNYPAPANAHSVSQNERQLAAIGSTLAHHLSSRVSDPARYELVVSNERTDDLPSVKLYAGSLKLYFGPLFPGSLMRNDICIHAQFNGKPLMLSEYFDSDETTTIKLDTLQQIASISNAALLHARHTPLPEHLGQCFYRNGTKPRVIIHPENSDRLSASSKPAGLHNLVEQIMNLDQTNENKPRNNQQAPVYICQPLNGKNSHSPIRSKLAQTLGRPVEILTIRKGLPVELLSLIARADVLISADKAVINDAIQLSIPVAIPGASPDGFEDIQIAFENYLLHLDSSRLVDEQTRALDNHRLYRLQADSVCNSQEQLLSLLEKILTQVLPHWQAAAPALSEKGTESPLLVIAPVDQTLNPELAQRINLSIERNRRKLIKFRESPGRFLRDSKHPLTRPFQSWFE